MKLKVGREKYNREAAKLKWLERLEKLQEKVVMRKKAVTARAREKNDIELIKRAEKAEADAIATLERIRADKKRIEQELENINSEQEEPSSGAVDFSSTPTLTVGESEEEEEENYLEKYPVNEPYAYVVITATSPPLYKVKEVKLTRGEAELLKELKTRLYETLDVSLKDVKDAEEILKKKVRELIEEFSLGDALSNESLDKIMYYLKRDLVGFGKLDPLMHDKMAEDISADGPGIPLFVYHRVYGSIETNIIFDKEELDALIYKLAQRSGRHISLAKPLLDAALPNQDRLQLSMGSEVTARGSTFTIRKFRGVPITPIDLVNYGTFSLEMMAYLWMAVDNGSNILIAGGTASGKTTVLNAIAMFIPPESKIVSIEDTREINLLHKNWIPAVTREVEEGAHGIEMFDLLRSALRQRPEYVLVGEVRGREAHTLFQAMATGHITMSTFHADSAETVVKRLTKQPINVPLMLLDSLDIIPIQKMTKVGNKLARRCTKIVEVTGVDFENETLKTNDLFMWHPDEFEFSGESEVFVKIMDKLNMSEMELGEEFARRRRVLEGLQQRGMSDFQSLNKVLHDYSIDPEATEKKIWVER